MNPDQMDRLLADAVVVGNEASLEALVEIGPDAVQHFRSWLSGELQLELPRGRDREFIDNTTAVSSRLALSHPGEFLSAFSAPRWGGNSFVLVGLGCTGLTGAQTLLIEALASGESSDARVSAAIALGRFPGEDSARALTHALDDEEYLVRYHAIRSLGHVGDRQALDRLLVIANDPPNRGIAMVAPSAAKTLAQRLGLNIDIPRPDMSRWPSLTFRLATDTE